MLERRKIAGILAEGSGSGQTVDYIVVGFGINLRRTEYPSELEHRASSLEAELGHTVDRGQVLVESLAAMAEVHRELLDERFDAILTRWRRLAPSSVGSPVEWKSPSGPVRGTAAGVDDQGALLIRVGERLVHAMAGEVMWL
jgi:BirA family transcriptional regulator, biotin operon repressor / biotin---[acetyl-CoA-carboxylase] ligase